jgi:hypothetical protein
MDMKNVPLTEFVGKTEGKKLLWILGIWSGSRGSEQGSMAGFCKKQ